MMVFIDTSALYAVFDRDDRNHTAAAQRWQSLLDSDARLVTHNYVVLELTALLRSRLGMEAVRDLTVEVLPVLTVQWVSETIHAQGLHAMLAAGRRKLSLTDCVSFEIMRRNGCTTAFVFDPHFEERGFTDYSTEAKRLLEEE
ncbi:MAG: PIN domain-containing protein [Spirochaeta sp.]|jgi:predicted nucleic acid-binding protein|nr:PIN domain-containing protein [Spirochaeta sp.]